MTNASCRYCGDTHDVRDLCRARAAGLSRRRFLFLGGMAAAATVLPVPSILAPPPTLTEVTIVERHQVVPFEDHPITLRVKDLDAILKAIWLPAVTEEINRRSPFSEMIRAAGSSPTHSRRTLPS